MRVVRKNTLIWGLRFEYGAILKGSQTISTGNARTSKFEYGAILKGSQTIHGIYQIFVSFEYGAILKGSQTKKLRSIST